MPLAADSVQPNTALVLVDDLRHDGLGELGTLSPNACPPDMFGGGVAVHPELLRERPQGRPGLVFGDQLSRLGWGDSGLRIFDSSPVRAAKIGDLRASAAPGLAFQHP